MLTHAYMWHACRSVVDNQRDEADLNVSLRAEYGQDLTDFEESEASPPTCENVTLQLQAGAKLAQMAGECECVGSAFCLDITLDVHILVCMHVCVCVCVRVCVCM